VSINNNDGEYYFFLSLQKVEEGIDVGAIYHNRRHSQRKRMESSLSTATATKTTTTTMSGSVDGLTVAPAVADSESSNEARTTADHDNGNNNADDGAREKKVTTTTTTRTATTVSSLRQRHPKLIDDIIENVDFFRLHCTFDLNSLRQKTTLYYNDVPPTVDWGDPSSINRSFPPLRRYGKFVIPSCLLLEVRTEEEKLVVINYWRSLRQEQQKVVKDLIRRYYVRPSISNERMNWNRSQTKVKSVNMERSNNNDNNDNTISTATTTTTSANTITVTVPTTLLDDPSPSSALLAIERHAQFVLVVRTLTERVDFFRREAPLSQITKLYYTTIPSSVKWEDTTSVQRVFPPIPQCNKQCVPLCLIEETTTDEERLVVVNWWRYITTLQVPHVLADLRKYYKSPMQSSEKLPTLVSQVDKRKQYATQPTWGFRCVQSTEELATKLRLSSDMLRSVSLEDEQCKLESCVYPAVCNNNGYCCYHRVSFVPLKGKERGRRGYLLLGPTYTRQNPRPCSCNDETCVGIGYSPIMIRLDTTRLSKELHSELCETLLAIKNSTAAAAAAGGGGGSAGAGGSSPTQRRRSVLPKSACLAPWHFHPEHRVFLEQDGSWKLIDHTRTTIFNDTATGRAWPGIPPPTYNPKGMLKIQAWKKR
jgi:hypothetical protein